jgi:hypothetical protein
VLYGQFPVEQASFFKPKPRWRMAPFYLVRNGQNGMGVAVMTATREGIRWRASARNQNFGKDAALQPFSYCSEVCNADARRLQCFGTER